MNQMYGFEGEVKQKYPCNKCEHHLTVGATEKNAFIGFYI